MMEPLAETTEPVEPDTAPLEQDEDDDEEGAAEEEPEAAPESEPEPAGLSPRQLEAQQEKLEKERTRHANRVSDILGEAANDLLPCPICDPELGGFMYEATLTHPRDDVHARLLTVLTEPVGPDYLQDPDVDTCDRCQGKGKNKTGSDVPGQETRGCKKCAGVGYYPPPGSPQNGVAPEPGPQPVLEVVGGGPQQDDADPWGSPRILVDGRENPNYGKMPQYKSPEWP